MKLYSSDKAYKLYQGSMLDMLEDIQPNSVDSIITDPPYELGFMGKSWDNSGIAFQKETWQKCLEVLKPGGHLLAFGGSRTFHRIAVAIEDAGFEIRDTIIWMYGSGFPKSMSIGKGIESKLVNGSANTQDFRKLSGTKEKVGNWGISKMVYEQGARPADYTANDYERTVDVDYQTEEGKKWDGWGTALKPSFEPIIIARKPFDGSCIDNVLKYGVGGINIDECRIGIEQRTYKGMSVHKPEGAGCFRDDGWQPKDINVTVNGRFPSNVILTYDDTDFEEVCGGFPYTESNGGTITVPKMGGGELGVCNYQTVGADRVVTNYTSPLDSGSASRYFYCAKASKKDRDEGLDDFELKGAKELLNREENSDGASWNGKYSSGNAYAGAGCPKKNIHPTVKPCELMQYLVRLVTPDGGIVLDPFNGSGSTGKAVMYENKERDKGYTYIGIELTDQYLPISKARIEYAEGVRYEVREQDDGSVTEVRRTIKQNKLF